MDTGYAHKKQCRARNCGVSLEGRKGSVGWKGFVKQVGFEPGVKSEGVVDGDSGEPTVENGVAGVGRDELELESFVRGCRIVARSWFERRGEAY